MGRLVVPLVCNTRAASSGDGTAASHLLLFANSRPGEAHVAVLVEGCPDVDDRRRRRAAGLFASGVRGDERLGVGVVDVEPELGGLVGRVQGGRRAGRCDGQERNDCLNAIGQDDGYPVAAAYAHGPELLRQGSHLTPQGVVGDDGPAGGHYGRVGRRARCQKVDKRAGRGRIGHAVSPAAGCIQYSQIRPPRHGAIAGELTAQRA